jgi:inner membrane protein
MASIFGHATVAFTISKLSDSKNLKWLVLAAIGSSILPDLDVLAFKFGIPYLHPFGHRGFTHSIFFGLVWAVILMFLFGKNKRVLWFAVIFLSTVSHGVLDAMTSGGRGVGFFIPFVNERFFFPWRNILVSPINIKDFFSDWGVAVILSELEYIIMPCAIVLVISFIIRRFKT